MIDFINTFDSWSEKLSLNPDMPALERIWLHHETGYCHLKSGNIEQARKSGEAAYSLARDIGDTSWKLDASMLIAQAMSKFDASMLIAQAMSKLDASMLIAQAMSKLDASMLIAQAMSNSAIFVNRCCLP